MPAEENNQAEEVVEEKEFAPKAPREADKGKKWFYNSTVLNIYTEDGRCRPNEPAQLTPETAKKYKGLKACR